MDNFKIGEVVVASIYSKLVREGVKRSRAKQLAQEVILSEFPERLYTIMGNKVSNFPLQLNVARWF